MNVLVVNAGSSTLKYQVIDTKSHKVSAKGSCERVCFTGGTFTHAANGSKKVTENIEFPDHKVAIEVVLKDLEANGVKIEGIGHRIVQGGWYFGDSSLVDEDVLAKIREVAPLAPLHNNPEANVIEYCLEQYPDLPNVTVYDTAFHFNMPEVAKTYALPKDVCDKLHIRKYGAHGTSYRYISKKVAEMTNGGARKVVVCHIGSGASLCAIEDGKLVWNDKLSIPLNPMIGVIGVAPAGQPVNCGTPGSHGGNMDNTAITTGATLYFPVAVEGALFGCGDMHAVMGDGEVSVSGAEVAGYATVTLTALPDLQLVDPIIENATHLGIIASAESLDAAADRAVHEMVDLLHNRTGVGEDELVMLLSLVADVQVCQMVDPEKTVRFMVPKYVLDALGFAL